MTPHTESAARFPDAEAIARAVCNALASIEVAGNRNTVAGRDVRRASARRGGLAVAGDCFVIHVHISAEPRRDGGAA